MKRIILGFMTLVSVVSCQFDYTVTDIAFDPIPVPGSRQGQWAAFFNGLQYTGSLKSTFFEGDTLKLRLTGKWEISIPVDELYSGSMADGTVIKFGDDAVYDYFRGKSSVMENSSVWLRHVSDSTISGFFCFSGEYESYDGKKEKIVVTDGTFASMISRQ